MTLAARELGDDAMLVYSREASPEARYLGKYEVVFAMPRTDSECAVPAPSVAAPDPLSELSPLPDPLCSPQGAGIISLQSSLRRLGQARSSFHNVNRQAGAPAIRPACSPLDEAGSMEVPEISPKMYRDLSAPGECARRRWKALGKALESVWPPMPCLAPARLSGGVIGLLALGKTSTLVKLAARYGFFGAPVRAIVRLTRRIAGANSAHLRRYSGCWVLR